VTFGKQVREYRKAIGISQRDLAERVTAMASQPDERLDWIELSKIENDRLPPPSYTVISRMTVVLSPDPDIDPGEIHSTLLRLSREPFVPAPSFDSSDLAIRCGHEDDLETWQEKLNSWQAMVGR
jgi:transcriptional regulator with XRE-family HTH domain